MKLPKELLRAKQLEHGEFTRWQRLCLLLAGIQPARLYGWREQRKRAARLEAFAYEQSARIALLGGVGPLAPELEARMREAAERGDLVSAGMLLADSNGELRTRMN